MLAKEGRRDVGLVILMWKVFVYFAQIYCWWAFGQGMKSLLRMDVVAGKQRK